MTRRALFASAVVFVLAVAPAGAGAQHEGHDMSAMSDSSAPRLHLMAQAIPLVTRADPTAGGTAKTQALLTQLVLMGRASFWRGHGALDAALNGEGFTMRDGELN